ncbi:MAG: hypothetical protein VKK59_05760 [Vampirovibrionales bacterium]|nr:hypothetical protein [Vampirovibrionales bacterium]
MSHKAKKQRRENAKASMLRWLAVTHVTRKQTVCCQLDASDKTTLNIPVYSEIHFLDASGRVCLPFKPIAFAC